MIAEILVGTAATAFLGVTSWAGVRMVGKIDKMDLVIRGDGNGNPGINERIREVHTEVSHTRRELKEHADSEEERLLGLMLKHKEQICDEELVDG